MLRLFPAQADDLLDVESLPNTDNTELNYRTRPLTPEQEQRLTLLILLAALPLITILSVTTYWITSLHEWLDYLVFAASLVILVWFGLRCLTGALVYRELVVGLLFSISMIGSLVWDWAQRGGEWSWRVGLVAAWIASCLIARQVAAWILVAPTVDDETMRCWRVNLPRIIPHGLSLDCPELLTYSVSSLMVGPAWWLAVWLAVDVCGAAWCWPFCFVVSLHVIWLVWHVVASPFVPWPNLWRSWKMTWQALVVFITYDIYFTPAAGVFRFPTRALRCPLHRWLLVIGVQVIIAFGYALCCPNPVDTFRQQGMFFGQLLANLLMISAAGPLVFCTILWFTAGTLLVRFDEALSHHADGNTTDWDNYIGRLLNSEDELEQQHLLLGTSETGDYPILVHQEIHDQHGHILGDSGASKTALGIAPQATQLIARADSTVVIVDLKGDKALFESCQREAARTGKMRFRWLSNEVGKTTFGFNPLQQSHNRLLSVEQLTQQILQGLSLDYGLQYGAAYFTAMNEIVLSNVLKETGARSFRELSEHLADRSWYGSIGNVDDWSQARHLGALVSRLAASEAINTTAGMYPDQPEVHSEAIDVSNLLAEPQVVYLSLRSAVEPTNAPAIARLFLWAMFTAASHQPQDQNRVYFFIDEIQQIIGDGIKLIFEQFRDLGGTIIAAHQTAGQLNRQGTDLGDTIDSCTAVKQIFRASDLPSLERIEKLSGIRRENTPSWHQTHERGTGDLTDRYQPIHATDGEVRVSEQERPRYGRDEVLAISSRRQSSLIRFTFGSGYTQFAGATVPMISQYHISMDEYRRRRLLPWPTAPGAFTLLPPEHVPPLRKTPTKKVQRPSQVQAKEESAFARDFQRRAKRDAAE